MIVQVRIIQYILNIYTNYSYNIQNTVGLIGHKIRIFDR